MCNFVFAENQFCHYLTVSGICALFTQGLDASHDQTCFTTGLLMFDFKQVLAELTNHFIAHENISRGVTWTSLL